MDINKLQNFGEAAAVGLAQTLTALMGRDVLVSLSRVSNEDTKSVASGLDSSYLVAALKGSGGVDGTALLLTKEKNSSVLADLLIGQDGTSAPEKMTELHLSAFGEVLHQMAEVFTTEGKKVGGSKVLWEAGEPSTMESSSLDRQLSQLGVTLTVFNFAFNVQDLLTGEFLFCLPESVASRFSTGAGKPAAPVASGNVQSGVSTVNTQSRAGGASVQQLENEFSGSARPTGGNIGLLLDVPLKLTVELGRTTKLVKEILALAPGSVVELDKLAGEAVDILVNEKLIAKGEVVVIDENFGVRITEIINPEERLHAVQA